MTKLVDEITCDALASLAGIHFLSRLPPAWIAYIHGRPGKGYASITRLVDAVMDDGG